MLKYQYLHVTKVGGSLILDPVCEYKKRFKNIGCPVPKA